jgi:hypothetical protein
MGRTFTFTTFDDADFARLREWATDVYLAKSGKQMKKPRARQESRNLPRGLFKVNGKLYGVCRDCHGVIRADGFLSGWHLCV